MHRERRILANAGTFTAGEVVGQLANFAFVVGFARVFGVGTLAQYSIGMSIGALLAIFVDLGAVGLVTRESSRKSDRARTLIGVLLPAQIPLAIILWAIGIGVGAWLLGARSSLIVLACACGYQILLSFAALILAPFIGIEQVAWSAFGGAAHRLLAVVLGALAVFLGAGPGMTSAALTASAVALILVALAGFTRRFGVPPWRFAPRVAARVLQGGSAFFGMMILDVVYARGGLIILSMLAPHESVGLFAVADRIIVAPGMLPIMFVSAVYPALSRLAGVSVQDVQALTGRCGRLLLVGTIPLATLLTLLAPEIVQLLFGRGFSPAAAALQVLAWTLPLGGTRRLLGVQMLALDQRAALVRVRALGLGVFLVSCPALILLGAGFKGPAWALLLSEAFQVTCYMWLLRGSRSAAVLTKAVLAPLLAAALTIVVGARFLPALPALVRAISLILLMLGALLISGSVRVHDLRFLHQILARKEPDVRQDRH